MVLTAVTVLMGIGPGPALSLVMTIDAIEDAGQFPGQEAYLKFVYLLGEFPVTTSKAPSQWYSRVPVDQFASDHGIPGDWELQSAGNIWSSDKIVGEALNNLSAGIYRVSGLDGAFMYDSFNWSDYKGQWWWQLHIQSSMLPLSLMLGDTNWFSTDAEALANSFGEYLDIPVNEGGSLIFWIYDTNSIDNLGSLTFNVVLIPEPSTIILVGTGLLLLLRRYRKYISAH